MACRRRPQIPLSFPQDTTDLASDQPLKQMVNAANSESAARIVSRSAGKLPDRAEPLVVAHLPAMLRSDRRESGTSRQRAFKPSAREGSCPRLLREDRVERTRIAADDMPLRVAASICGCRTTCTTGTRRRQEMRRCCALPDLATPHRIPMWTAAIACSGQTHDRPRQALRS